MEHTVVLHLADYMDDEATHEGCAQVRPVMWFYCNGAWTATLTAEAASPEELAEDLRMEIEAKVPNVRVTGWHDETGWA